MIDNSTTATTAEILLLIDLSKQRLSQLEQAEIIRRIDKDKWPLVATIKALLADARRRSSEFSEAKARLERIKADRERLKLMRETKEVVPASDLTAFIDFMAGTILPVLGALPARLSGRDRELHRRAQRVVIEAQQQISDACGKECDRLLGGKDGGKAA